MPTLTFGAESLMFTMGESVAKYMSVAPESTMHVDVMSGLIGEDLSRVGLKLAL